MHHLLTIIFLLFAIHLNAQSDTIPPPDSLIQSLTTYHHQQLQAELTEFQISEKGSWLKYIPSVGVGYSLGTDNNGNLKNVLRPSLSYSTNTIYQVKQDKEIRRAKLESIKQASALELQKEKLELQLMIRQYENEMDELDFMLRLNELDTELYEIATVQFTSTKIAPSAYLPKKRAYLQKQFEIFQKQKLIRNLVAEIKALAKY